MDVKQAQIVPDQVQHRLDRSIAEKRQPLAFRSRDKSIAVLRSEDGSDGLQIVARVKTLADLADILSQRLAVSEMHRPCERIDLRSGVVDVIFLGDAEPRRLEQPSETVADDGAAAMPHVERTGRIGRDIFDVDPLVGADVRQAVLLALAQDGAQLVAPGIRVQPNVDEARTCHLHRRDRRKRLQLRLDRLGKRSRIRVSALRKDHRRIGGEIAVRRIAGRLDRDVATFDPFGKSAVTD